MIHRDLTARVRAAARSFPAMTITGPRQSGKSTLCRSVFAGHAYANLERPDVRSFALEDPDAFLAQFPDGAVISFRLPAFHGNIRKRLLKLPKLHFYDTGPIKVSETEYSSIAIDTQRKRTWSSTMATGIRWWKRKPARRRRPTCSDRPPYRSSACT